jgi:uncharacterized protein
MSMHLEGSAQRLTIFCGESDKAAHSHKPLHVEIVQRARKSRLAGTTVLRGVEGFGASSVVHTTRFLSMSEDLPMVLVIVDTKERIQAFLPQLDDLIEEGLVIVEDVTVLKYVGRPDGER